MRGHFATTAAIADRQHGRVARWQLLAAGVDRNRIDRWLADGRLRLVHKAVYAVGHAAPSVDGDYMAAVLACGPGAVLSHRAAAYKLRLLRGAAAPAPEVTVPTIAGRRRPGIFIHRVRSIDDGDAGSLDAIPMTSVARVLLDLAPSTAPEALTRLCHEAWVHHRVGPREIEACIARNPRKKGAAKLRAAVGGDVLLSELEKGFLRLLDAHGLPRPRTNVDRAGDKVDCHWPSHGLTVELVSFRYHGSRHAFERDVARRRRSDHVAYSHGDVFERGAATAADLRDRLASCGGTRARCAGPSAAAAGGS